MTVTIRLFRETDQLAAKRLILAGLAERWGTLDETRNPDLDDLQASHIAQGGTVLVAEMTRDLESRIIGTGTLTLSSPDVGQIVRMSVGAGARRQGVARQLVAALLETARASGHHRVIVETTDTWHSAIALYEQCGFVRYDHISDEVYLQFALR